MSSSRENISIEVKRDALRRKVREMEAFGWVLGDTEDLQGKMVKLDFWRSLNIPNLNKLRKLEFDLSRLPKENSAFNLKFIVGVIICILLATITGTGFDDPLIAVIIGVAVFEIFFLLLVAVMNPEYKRLSKRRDRILHRAKMFIDPVVDSGGAILRRDNLELEEPKKEDELNG